MDVLHWILLRRLFILFYLHIFLILQHNKVPLGSRGEGLNHINMDDVGPTSKPRHSNAPWFSTPLGGLNYQANVIIVYQCAFCFRDLL